MMILIVLSLLCNLAPLVLLLLWYANIPASIPAFVDLWGNAIMFVDKSYLTVSRLPMMGIILTALCVVMYGIQLPKEKRRFNKIIWAIVAFIASLKMGLTSLEVLFIRSTAAIQYFRIAILILVVAGVIVLGGAAFKLYKNNIQWQEYKSGMSKIRTIIVAALVMVYVAIAAMPSYI